MFDVTAWLTNNYNTHIAQYLPNYRQSENDIWSVNKIKQDKIFYIKNHAENGAGRLVPDLFLFFKKGKSECSVAWFRYV